MNSQEQHAGHPLPRYRCHKEVRALKIAAVEYDARTAEFWIAPEPGQGRPFGKFQVSEEYVKKHKPAAGGYYVLYDDGYESFSPAAPFESGYTLITSDAPETADPQHDL